MNMLLLRSLNLPKWCLNVFILSWGFITVLNGFPFEKNGQGFFGKCLGYGLCGGIHECHQTRADGTLSHSAAMKGSLRKGGDTSPRITQVPVVNPAAFSGCGTKYRSKSLPNKTARGSSIQSRDGTVGKSRSLTILRKPTSSFSRDSSSLVDSNGSHSALKTLADEQGAGKIIPGNIPSLRSPQWRKSLKPEEEDNHNNNRVLANQKLNESIPGHSRGNLKQGLKESIPDHFHESIEQEPNVSRPDHFHENVKQEPNESMPDHSHESFRGFWEQEPTGQPPATHEAALPGVESWWER
ncbi:hypothetical protein PGT21_025716 [Puccinia graminis f. sp. tritici]|uniref:Uncharacterized protein n=1 Tax=Puccinia graminis f. sp. tritici TaxID=56615 RepID=A0A5B0QBS1_PUCGR|nr:hypothetical protein PGT21_025716 [Puccinia graminis f. sp. tritici]